MGANFLRSVSASALLIPGNSHISAACGEGQSRRSICLWRGKQRSNRPAPSEHSAVQPACGKEQRQSRQWQGSVPGFLYPMRRRALGRRAPPSRSGPGRGAGATGASCRVRDAQKACGCWRGTPSSRGTGSRPHETSHRGLIVTVRDSGLADVQGVGPLGDVGALADRRVSRGSGIRVAARLCCSLEPAPLIACVEAISRLDRPSSTLATCAG